MMLLQHFNATLLELIPQNNAKLPFLTIIGNNICFFFIPTHKPRPLIVVYAFYTNPLTFDYISLPFKYATWTLEFCAYFIGRCVL